MVRGIIINPGSGGIPDSGTGWTNTYDGALREAREWHGRMADDGIRDVDLILPGVDLNDGRWRFAFRHRVTGVLVHLDTHGLSDWRAYDKERVFAPKVYWARSSCASPAVEDWVAPRFEVVKTLRPLPAGE